MDVVRSLCYQWYLRGSEGLGVRILVGNIAGNFYDVYFLVSARKPRNGGWYAGNLLRTSLWLEADLPLADMQFLAGGCGRSNFQNVEKVKNSAASVRAFFDGCAYGDELMKKVDAFVTIEYTLLLPVLLMLYTFLIYIGLYQYNQCIMQNNVCLLALEGYHKNYAAEEFKPLYQMEEELNADKYILGENIRTQYEIRRGKLRISSQGELTNPLSKLGLGQAQWELRGACEVSCVQPTQFLRLSKEIVHDW